MSLQPLTVKQRRVYTEAVHHYAAIGEPCSLSWLARRLHKHRQTIRERAQAIIRKGWAARDSPAFRRLNL